MMAEASPTQISLMEQLEQIIDPEVGYSIVGLGLVYGALVDPVEKKSQVRMTLTSPACPLAAHFQQAVEQKLAAAWPDWQHEVVITFEPPWSPQLIKDDIKEQLKISGLPLS